MRAAAGLGAEPGCDCMWFVCGLGDRLCCQFVEAGRLQHRDVLLRTSMRLVAVNHLNLGCVADLGIQASQEGKYQFHLPRSFMLAGSRTIRTRVASSRTAVASPIPASFIDTWDRVAKVKKTATCGRSARIAAAHGGAQSFRDPRELFRCSRRPSEMSIAQMTKSVDQRRLPSVLFRRHGWYQPSQAHLRRLPRGVTVPARCPRPPRALRCVGRLPVRRRSHLGAQAAQGSAAKAPARPGHRAAPGACRL
jgi:hypothetical protein